MPRVHAVSNNEKQHPGVHVAPSRLSVTGSSARMFSVKQ